MVVRLIYYGGLLAIYSIVMVTHGIKTVWPHHDDAARNPVTAQFDVDKNCETVYINSPVEYYNGTKSKSGKDCVIRVITYNAHVENEAPPPAVLDTSRSVPVVLEIPSIATGR